MEMNGMTRFALCALSLVLIGVGTFAADKPKSTDKEKAKTKPPAATPAEQLKVAKDFKAELLYSVPKDTEGSWVNLCHDPKGRLIVSDQYGPLYRVTPPPIGGNSADTKVEKIDLPIGEAQGLLWAFGSLYVVVNRGQKYESGLYRVHYNESEDKLDKVELLTKIQGGGEHGPHAVLLTPDGKSLAIVCGNGTKMMKYDTTRVPPVWGEDHLLPRMPDGNGFMAGVLGPGGCIYQVDPEGKNWELISVGYRNEFDAAFNRDGDLFTYDADMEWDMNTPWYRPTRVCHVVSGSEWGWRNGTGKWPTHYPDTLPPVVDVGPGSPTGICFGYGAKFPAKYQDALLMCDWSYGKLYACHLTPEGSTYKGELEEFVSGAPLPLTDVIVNPKDGAVYFTVGGRKTQSGLYRVTYVGKESTAPTKADTRNAEARAARRKLEAFHGKKDGQAIETAWPHLANADRFVRSAARTALEHQDPAGWREKALKEKDPQASLTALLGLVRAGSRDPQHRKKEDPASDATLQPAVLEALQRLDWEKLTYAQRLELLRIYAVLFVRTGKPADDARKALLARFDPLFPTKGREANGMLCELLIYLDAPGIAARGVKMLENAPTQEEQIDYAKSLRMVKTGWTPELRKTYFSWFVKAATYKGGSSFSKFVNNIKNEAVATLTPEEKTALKEILESRPSVQTPTVKPRPFVKNWTTDELVALTEKKLNGRDFDHGRAMFAQANCFACHRFNNEGGSMGPDLSVVSGRFGPRDLIESIVEPSKVISDQYVATVFETTDGKVVTGRIVNASGDTIFVNTNMLDPNLQEKLDRRKVESMKPSPISMMPTELLSTFKEDEILDLLAYLLSRGDPSNKIFKK
jgi:putative heme-binding domain-containing protein